LPAGSRPNALLVDKLGIVWISTSNPGILLSLDPEHNVLKNLAIPDASHSDLVKGNSTMVWTMVQDSDGKIWFSDLGMKSIWQLEPENGTFHQFHSETGSPFQMKSDKHEKIWFTTLLGNTIGVIEKPSKSNEYKILAFSTRNNTTPAGIFLQGDSVWVVGINSQNILQYKINQENDFVKGISMIQNIPSDNSTLFASPTDLLVRKNAVWLTEHGTSFLARYDLDDGKITRYPTSQNHFHTITLPFWIRGNDDPNILWFNEHQGNKIGCFDLYNETLTEYTIPSLPQDGYLTYPLNISEDLHDEKILWFSEWNTDKVGVINGHVQVPFEISSKTKQITLSSSKTDGIVDLEISGNSYHSNGILLNASSSITPTAELGNLTVRFSSNMVDLTQDSKIQLFLHNGGVSPGNYTVGVSASDGFVTKTTFLNLSISNK
jgi:streptogramin lyase